MYEPLLTSCVRPLYQPTPVTSRPSRPQLSSLILVMKRIRYIESLGGKGCLSLGKSIYNNIPITCPDPVSHYAAYPLDKIEKKIKYLSYKTKIVS